MTRRLALACSFALTIVVSVAVASLVSQAGWLGRPGSSAEADALLQAPEPTVAPVEAAPPPPQVVTDYVYVDVPVVRQVQIVQQVAPSAAAQAAASTVLQETPLPPAQLSPSGDVSDSEASASASTQSSGLHASKAQPSSVSTSVQTSTRSEVRAPASSSARNDDDHGSDGEKDKNEAESKASEKPEKDEQSRR